MSGLNVFKFLDSYTKEDRSVFFGREPETEEIYQRCSFSKTLVVYGRSGTGKTSIIRCGLGNAFNEQDWLPVFVRRSTEINRDTIRAIRGEAVSESKGENSLSKEVRNLYLDHFKPVYLIFDQFEELFIFGGSEEIETFFASIKLLIESDQDVHLIFVIREEYLAYLTEAEEVIPEFLENRIRIEHLTAKKLRETVEKMCEAAGIELEEGFSEELTERMTSGKAPLELSYLQVYLDSIRKKYPDTHRFSKEMIEALGSFGDVLGDFLQRQLNEQPDPAKAETVLKAFVSAQGTKRLIDTLELKQLTAEFGVLMEMSELDTYVNRFIDGRILRQVGEDGKYELRHDTLAKVIYERITLAEKELLEAKQFVHNAYNRFQKNGTQLRDEDLDYLAPYAKRLYLKDEQKKFLNEAFAKKERRQRRKLRLTQIGVGVLLLLLIGAGYLLYQNYQENQLQARIDESHRLAKLSKSDDIGDPMLAFLLAEKAHEVYEGAHTHNALLEAYDRGGVTLSEYPFRYVNVAQADSLISYYSDENGMMQLDLKNGEKTHMKSGLDEIDAINWYNHQFFSWGYLTKSEKDNFILSFTNDGDTIDFRKCSGEIGKIHNHRKKSSKSAVIVDSVVFVLNSKGEFDNSIILTHNDFNNYEFIRSDTLFILNSKESYAIDLSLKSVVLSPIELDLPEGSIRLNKAIGLLQFRSENQLILLDPQNFNVVAKFDLEKITLGLYDTFGVRVNSQMMTISDLDEEKVVVKVDLEPHSSNGSSQVYSIIFERKGVETDILGLVDGEILGYCDKNCFLTYSESSSSISLEKHGGNLNDLFGNMVKGPVAFDNVKLVDKSFENVKLLAKSSNRILVQSTSDVPGTCSYEAIAMDGTVIWSIPWSHSGRITPSTEAAIIDKYLNTYVLVKSEQNLFLYKMDPAGKVLFQRRIFLLDQLQSLQRKPEIFLTSSGEATLVLDDRIISISELDGKYDQIRYGIHELLDLQGENLIIDSDSTLSIHTLSAEGQVYFSAVLVDKDTFPVSKVNYWPDSKVLQVTYEIGMGEGFNKLGFRESSIRKDFYSLSKQKPSNTPFLSYQVSNNDVTKRRSMAYPLRSSEYGLLLTQKDNYDSEVTAIFFKHTGESDTLELEKATGYFRQFKNSLYACSKDTIVEIDLSNLEIKNLEKPESNRYSSIHALYDTIPLMDFREKISGGSQWLEHVNTQNQIDTLYGDFSKVRLDTTKCVYYATKSNRYVYSNDEGKYSSFSLFKPLESDSLIFLDNQGKLVNKVEIGDQNDLSISASAFDNDSYLISQSDYTNKKLSNSQFEPYFSFPIGYHLKESDFIHDKYLLTKHRLLNQYELFPINGNVAIEMVREQGRLGEVREFTEEEIEKYQLN